MDTRTITVERTPDALFQAAIDLARDGYFQHVRELAEELASECRSGELADRDALIDRIHETCDSDSWVIYTARAQLVLVVSQNDGAYADNFGPEGIVTDGAINWSALAYAALEQDLYEQLDAEGLDVNDDSEWRETDDADESDD